MHELILTIANGVLIIALVTCISWVKKMSDSLSMVNNEIARVKTDIEWIKNNLEGNLHG